PGVPVIFYNCDPKEDDKDADLADHNGRPGPVPFDDGIDNSPSKNGEPFNLSIEKIHLLPDDPDGIIKTLRVYDLLGRLMYTEENIPLVEYTINAESLQ